MSFLNSALRFITAYQRNSYVTPRLNHVDADIQLIQYHESGTGAKPAPEETKFLPLRTRLAVSIFSPIHNAQTHAYYEEIDTIPSVLVGTTSIFSGGQWYIIHPMWSKDLVDLSTRLLLDLKQWIEVDCPNEFFIRKTKQVLEFRNARSETLVKLDKILENREARDEISTEEWYTGNWETIDEHWDVNIDEDSGMEGDTRIAGQGTNVGDKSQVTRHTVAALADAARAGREAAEEARIKNEYEFA